MPAEGTNYDQALGRYGQWQAERLRASNQTMPESLAVEATVDDVTPLPNNPAEGENE